MFNVFVCRKLCQFKMNGACTNEIIFCKKSSHLIVASHKGLFAWKLGNKVPKEDRYIYFAYFCILYLLSIYA